MFFVGRALSLYSCLIKIASLYKGTSQGKQSAGGNVEVSTIWQLLMFYLLCSHDVVNPVSILTNHIECLLYIDIWWFRYEQR